MNIDAMSVAEVTRDWYERFNRNAADLYPEVNYSLQYCRELAEMGLEIRRLARERAELLLAHYYTRPEIQKVADFVGDSLGLGLKAKEILEDVGDPNAAQTISGVRLSAVRFMGDTMKALLGEEIRVFMPKFAGCSLVASLRDLPFDYLQDSEAEVSHRLMTEIPVRNPIDEWLSTNPDGIVLSYINSDPEAKAKSYALYTSRNAMRVLEYTMRHNPGKRIYMLPDQYLSHLVLRMAQLQKNLWIKSELVDIFEGLCHVHKQKISPFALDEAMERHSNADLLVHPECGCAVDCLIRVTTGGIRNRKIHICSTQEMIWHAQSPNAPEEFLVATEIGHIFTLRDQVLNKRFLPVTPVATCEFMKSTTLPSLLESLQADNEEKHEVVLSQALCAPTKLAIDRMLMIQ